MSKGSRRALRGCPPGCESLPGPGSTLYWGLRRVNRLRTLWLVLGFLLLLCLWLYLNLERESGSNSQQSMEQKQVSHKPKSVSTTQVKHLVSQVSLQRFWTSHLKPMLIERYPGTPGSRKTRELIVDQLSTLDAEWRVDINTFQDKTPFGSLTFSNIIATLDPKAQHRLVLACHYDSKYFPHDEQGRAFVGATDSAVPCAIMLEVVSALDQELLRSKEQQSAMTLQLLFLDGEEAFKEWSDTDSLFGSRHLAEHMEKTKHLPGTSHGTEIQAISLFVLLDLLGAPQPLILNHFSVTSHWFDRLIRIEKRLHKLGLLQSHPEEQLYFRKDIYYGPVQDDHIPFLQRGVPVLHFISTPFPRVWHTMDDTEENLHPPTIENLCKIVTIFLAEYLQL
ncbi:glutaminyl-peptide cyclotransferase-like protein [Rhinatrema bivittatum]|uniref:glutaminyl-peptide cyclotransferase-like protein n=1 Tax=Rhinatrema bivittatum TaxID=194408 RepID=UPI00112BD8B5|nr:glutaminyl-peptide cyclotransferase-like protein [Rhinatrema bivittatum]